MLRLLEFKWSKQRGRGMHSLELNPDEVVCYGKIESDDGEREYLVAKYQDGTYQCTCIGKMFHRQTDCKHIRLFQEEERKGDRKEVGFWKSNWCQCRHGQTDTPVFFEDNSCTCGVGKHHYHCKWCGGITQTG